MPQPTTWYGEQGQYVMDLNAILRQRPKSGPADEFGDVQIDEDEWNRCLYDDETTRTVRGHVYS